MSSWDSDRKPVDPAQEHDLQVSAYQQIPRSHLMAAQTGLVEGRIDIRREYQDKEQGQANPRQPDQGGDQQAKSRSMIAMVIVPMFPNRLP